MANVLTGNWRPSLLASAVTLALVGVTGGTVMLLTTVGQVAPLAIRPAAVPALPMVSPTPLGHLGEIADPVTAPLVGPEATATASLQPGLGPQSVAAVESPQPPSVSKTPVSAPLNPVIPIQVSANASPSAVVLPSPTFIPATLKPVASSSPPPAPACPAGKRCGVLPTATPRPVGPRPSFTSSLGPCEGMDASHPACPQPTDIPTSLPSGTPTFIPAPTGPPAPGPIPSYDPAHPPRCGDPGNPADACTRPLPSPSDPGSNNNWDWELKVVACNGIPLDTVNALMRDKMTANAPYEGQCNYAGTRGDAVHNLNSLSVGFYGADADFMRRQSSGNAAVSGVGDKANWFQGAPGTGALCAFQGKYAVIVAIVSDADSATALSTTKAAAALALKWVLATNPPIPPAPTVGTPYAPQVSGPSAPNGALSLPLIGLGGAVLVGAGTAAASKLGLLVKLSGLIR